MTNKLFTDKTRKIIELASSAAQRAGTEVAGPDFVLIGIAHYGDLCVASAALKHLGVSLDAFAQPFGPRYAPFPKSTTKLSDEIAEMACKKARDLNHDYVGSEHLLLAVIQSNSAASAYLHNAGIDHQRLRDVTIELLG
jgi:ATP-dependent Clp protease ATP-binding subunit ClpC